MAQLMNGQPLLDPLSPILESQGVILLDGGLATELEEQGHDLQDQLWSARLLRDDPEAIAMVHREYLEAGADLITTASYQASVPAFEREGMRREEAEGLLRRSVDLAIRERDHFWATQRRRDQRLRPLVAASVGPYGAALADGSEYHGDYAVGPAGLEAFHASRLRLLAEAGADLLACETLPSRPEARVLGQLLGALPGARAWLSFSCRDGAHLADGASLGETVAELEGRPEIVAFGVNCVPPHWVPEAIGHLRKATTKPIVVYPNSGEVWDGQGRAWRGSADRGDAAEALGWLQAGARLIGGCCRVGPGWIRQARQRLIGEESSKSP